MSNIKIIQNDTGIQVEKLSKAHSLSTDLTFNTIARYSYIDNVGYIRQYFGEVPKEYKRLTNWKKAVKKIFDIDL